jgi:hypothetical protein
MEGHVCKIIEVNGVVFEGIPYSKSLEHPYSIDARGSLL